MRVEVNGDDVLIEDSSTGGYIINGYTIRLRGGYLLLIRRSGRTEHGSITALGYPMTITWSVDMGRLTAAVNGHSLVPTVERERYQSFHFLPVLHEFRNYIPIELGDTLLRLA